MAKQTGIIALMTVKGGLSKSAHITNDENTALATELKRK